MPLNFTKQQLRGFLESGRDQFGGLVPPELMSNAPFILEHWHRSGGGGTRTLYACDAFDVDTRLCTAHAERPPICRGFPWYDRPPAARKVRLPERCSFNADLGIPVSIG
jgi:Fe-S-cluster containining protein